MTTSVYQELTVKLASAQKELSDMQELSKIAQEEVDGILDAMQAYRDEHIAKAQELIGNLGEIGVNIGDALGITAASKKAVRSPRSAILDRLGEINVGEVKYFGNSAGPTGAQKIAARASYYGKRHNMKFTTKTMESGKVRVKRVS